MNIFLLLEHVGDHGADFLPLPKRDRRVAWAAERENVVDVVDSLHDAWELDCWDNHHVGYDDRGCEDTKTCFADCENLVVASSNLSCSLGSVGDVADFAVVFTGDDADVGVQRQAPTVVVVVRWHGCGERDCLRVFFVCVCENYVIYR